MTRGGNVLESAVIDFDLNCIACEYNLRGLQAGGLCPECGLAILATLSAGDPVDNFEMIDRLRRSALTPIANQLGCPVDGLLFLYDVLVRAVQEATERGESRVTAGVLCRMLEARARAYFNDPREAVELLSEWGIRRSEDVGNMIDSLVQARLISPNVCEQGAAFDGLFITANLWDRSRR